MRLLILHVEGNLSTQIAMAAAEAGTLVAVADVVFPKIMRDSRYALNWIEVGGLSPAVDHGKANLDPQTNYGRSCN